MQVTPESAQNWKFRLAFVEKFKVNPVSIFRQSLVRANFIKAFSINNGGIIKTFWEYIQACTLVCTQGRFKPRFNIMAYIVCVWAWLFADIFNHIASDMTFEFLD